MTGNEGSRYRNDLRSWAIQNRGGFIEFRLDLDAPLAITLDFTLCSGLVNGKTDCPIAIVVNGERLVAGFDPHLVNWYDKNLVVRPELLVAGANTIRIELDDDASTCVFVRDVRVSATIIRKAANAMTSEEQDRFKSVITELINNGTFGELTMIHTVRSHNMHGFWGPVGAQRFLPWHRVYLSKLEESMRTIDPQAFIPYWDWSTNQEFPQWLADFMPTVPAETRSGSITVTRNIGQGGRLATASEVNALLVARNEFTAFESQLESFHNQVHVWVGGTMNTMESPADAVFWMHHANVDRIWAEWQLRNPTKHPQLTGRDATMDPWSIKELQTRTTEDLNYIYE